jgi:malate synthase
MEDAATAEIARSQLWQWIRHGARTEDGQLITRERCRRILTEETNALIESGADPERLATAGELLDGLFSAQQFPEFLTLTAYEKLVN